MKQENRRLEVKGSAGASSVHVRGGADRDGRGNQEGQGRGQEGREGRLKWKHREHQHLVWSGGDT